MSIPSTPRTRRTPPVITPRDLELALRVSRSQTYKLFRRAGAIKVGGLLRLPTSRLADAIGDELAKLVIDQLAAEASP